MNVTYYLEDIITWRTWKEILNFIASICCGIVEQIEAMEFEL